MKSLNRWENMVFRMGAILMLAGAALHLFAPILSLYMYCIGAGAFSLMRLRTEYVGHSITIIRLRRQQLLASACFVFTAILMSMQDMHYGFAKRNEWIVSLIIGCILELYTSWRIPQELSKEENLNKS